MNQALKFLLPIKTKWDGFSPKAKRNLLTILISAGLCVAMISYFATRPNYVTVMSGLDNSSLGQVQAQLQTLKIPSEINGSSVMVPKADANEARIQLSMAGLPKSGTINYSSIQSSYAMTQDQFNLQVLNVLQESLQQTIDNMNGITSSQVHIVMPQQSDMFVSSTNPAKASVYLQVGNASSLSSAEIQGIQELVAHSVTGLAVNNVSVVDQNGITLSNSSSSQSGALSSNEMQQRGQIESQMQQQLLQGLVQIVGSGNAVVNVHADVTFNQTKTQTHTVTPAKGQQTGLPTSQQVVQNFSNSTNGGAGGIVGTSSSNPGSAQYYPGATGGSNSTSSNNETTTNYDNNYTNTQTVGDPIQINGYSVGVFINSNKKMTSAQLAQIKSFVQNSIGTQPNMKNSVSVSTMPFQKATTAVTLPTQKTNWMMYGLIGLGTLLLGGTLAFVFMRRRKKGEEVETVHTIQAPDDNLEIDEQDFVKRKISKLAAENTEQFSSLLRNWLNEE